jgi:membrane associated rhomboid family serine protease
MGVQGMTYPVVTVAILMVTIVTSVEVFKQRLSPTELMLDTAKVGAGERLRLITTTLVHGDPLHLIFNSLAMWSFGAAVERIMLMRYGSVGGLAFALFYMVACLSSSYLNVKIASFKRKRQLSVGASGAVLVLVAFVAVLYPTSMFMILVVPMPAWVFLLGFTAISLYAARKQGKNFDSVMTNGSSRIDHVGHLSGIAIGALSALLFL